MPIEQFWVRQITGDLRGQNFKGAPNDVNNLAPRLGLTRDPMATGKTVLRGGDGIYYDQINTTTMRGIVAGYPGFITTQIANDARSGARIPNDFFPNIPTQTFPRGAGCCVPHRKSGRGSGGEHFPLTRNVNARQADGTFPILASGLRLLLYDDSAPIRIHQAQFRLQKRFANKLGFLLGYTLGSAKSIADSGTPSDKYNLMADWGPTANDVRHRFVSNVIYQLPWAIQIGTIVSANSAPPFNITLGTDVNRDGDNNDRPAGVGYNDGRGDRFFQADIRTSKKITLGRVSGELLWEMFNVFNTVNFNNYQGNQSSAAGQTATGIPTGFGRPRQAFDPFQAQLGLKLTF